MVSLVILVFLGYQLRHVLVKKMATRCLMTLLVSDLLHLLFALLRVLVSQLDTGNEVNSHARPRDNTRDYTRLGEAGQEFRFWIQ